MKTLHSVRQISTAVTIMLLLSLGILSGCSGSGAGSGDDDSAFVDPNLSIGDTGPGGGTIVYVADDYSAGWKYLEAAPENAISDKYSSLTQAYMDEKGTTHITGTVSDLGAGKENTEAYITQSGNRAPAAAAAAAYTNGGKSDWYLPTLDEMSKLLSYFYSDPSTSTSYFVTSREHTATSSAGAYHARWESGSGFAWSALTATNENYIWPMRRF